MTSPSDTTITIYVEDGSRFEKYVHKQTHFPNYNEMMAYCKEHNIKAVDFEHTYRSRNRTFYVGRFVLSGGTSGAVKAGRRRGLGFAVRCNGIPTWEEWIR